MAQLARISKYVGPQVWERERIVEVAAGFPAAIGAPMAVRAPRQLLTADKPRHSGQSAMFDGTYTSVGAGISHGGCRLTDPVMSRYPLKPVVFFRETAE
jgi:hypothetical protein